MAGESLKEAEEALIANFRWQISQCKRLGQMHDACMVRYVGFIPKGFICGFENERHRADRSE